MDMEEKLKLKEDVVDWLELPDHLTFEIIGKLTSFFDYERFGVVCVKWRSLLLDEQQHEYCPKLPSQLPLLLIPTQSPPPPSNEDEDDQEKKKKEDQDDKYKSCSFYRITDKRVVCPQIQLKLPCERQFRGSGHGWIITLDDEESSNYPVQLINPFFFPHEPKVIPLPPLTAFPIELDKHGKKHPIPEDTVCNTLFLRKAILTADPISNPKDYMVIVIWGEYQRLAFFKPGDEAWTPIGYDSFKGLFEDVILYQGKVYGVHHYGPLAICDMDKCMAMKVVDSPLPKSVPDKKYLVESSGHLLQVHRLVKYLNLPTDHTYSTLRFKVFKLSLDPMGLRKPDWEEVKDLCGHALFLGYNLSMSICASDFPGCKPNCIYYTDDNIETHVWGYSGPHDMGVFNLEDDSFGKHYPTNIQDSILPNPIWIEPRLPRKKRVD